MKRDRWVIPLLVTATLLMVATPLIEGHARVVVLGIGTVLFLVAGILTFMKPKPKPEPEPEPTTWWWKCCECDDEGEGTQLFISQCSTNHLLIHGHTVMGGER